MLPGLDKETRVVTIPVEEFTASQLTPTSHCLSERAYGQELPCLLTLHSHPSCSPCVCDLGRAVSS